MIIVEEVNPDNSLERKKWSFFMIDAHHHIGEDEDGHKNLSVRGSFDFFRSIWKLLMKRYQNIKDFPELFTPKFKIVDISPPKPLKFLSSNPIHENSWIFDQFVAFPFQDVFRYRSQELGDKADYSNSNLRLSNIMSDFNTGSRLIGFCRLNPQNGMLSLQELEYAILQLGFKGIKLHPISDNWNDKISFNKKDSYVPKILRMAVKLNVPVIFDCRFITTLSWIYETVKKVRKELLEDNFTEKFVNSRLKVIIAHIGFLWQNDDLLFEVISHPNIYGDLTGQFSSKTHDLIERLKKNVICWRSDVPEWQKDSYWSTKIVMGSDFNYFEAFHIVDQLLYFLSEKFYELIDGNISIFQNIVSRNIARLLPKELPSLNGFQKESLSNKRISYDYCFKFSEPLYNYFIVKTIEFIQKKYSQKSPCHFRMDSLIDFYDHYNNPTSFINQNFDTTLKSLETQFNFTFQWRNIPFKLAGIKPQDIDRFMVYLICGNKGSISFERLVNDSNNYDNLKQIIHVTNIQDLDDRLSKIFNTIQDSNQQTGIDIS